MERTKSKTMESLYEFILREHRIYGKFTYTNRQLGEIFSRSARTMQYNLKLLSDSGLVECRTVVEDSGYVIRYVTPVNAAATVTE